MKSLVIIALSLAIANICTEASATKTGIVPRSEAHGVDFLGTEDYAYIVRSDLNSYMRTKNLNEGKDIVVYKLHQSCANGSHYLSAGDYFYIIKNNQYRRVKNMNTGEDPHTYALHSDFHGGDHYVSAYGSFYVIYTSKGKYRKTSNLNEGDYKEYDLDANTKGGLYYWGTDDYTYFIEPSSNFGIEYHRTDNLNKDSNSRTYPFHEDIINFLPGGLAIVQGPTYGKWLCITTLDNSNGGTELKQSMKIEHKVGFNSEKMSSIEHNWNVAATYSYSSGDLLKGLAQHQFSMTLAYGGATIDTSTESYHEQTTTTLQIDVVVLPYSTKYIWQYEVGLGTTELLKTNHFVYTDANTPPKTTPIKLLRKNSPIPTLD